MAYTYTDLIKNTYKPGEIGEMLGKSVRAIQLGDNNGIYKFERSSTGRRLITRDNLIELLKLENMWYESENRKKTLFMQEYLAPNKKSLEIWIDK